MGSLSHRCCSKQKVKRGLWSPEEDEKLLNYITIHGGQHGSWSSVPKLAGLERCGKSCRLRWTNYLRPEVKRGSFSAEEEEIIIDVHRILGNRWAQIAKHLPGRTDNEVKNFWNSCIKKKLIAQGLDPSTHNLISYSSSSSSSSSSRSNVNNVHHRLLSPQNQYHLQHDDHHLHKTSSSPAPVQDQQQHSNNNMAMITCGTDDHHHDASYQNPYTNNYNPFCWNLKHQNSNINGSGVGDDDQIIYPSKSTSSVTTAVSSISSSSSSINNMVYLNHSSLQFGVLNDHTTEWGSTTTTPAAALPVPSSLPLIQPPTSAMLYDHDLIIHQQQQEHYLYQLMKMSTQQLQLEPGQTKMDTASYDHDMMLLSSFDDDQLMDSIISSSGYHIGTHEHDLTASISMDDLIACNYECNF